MTGVLYPCQAHILQRLRTNAFRTISYVVIFFTNNSSLLLAIDILAIALTSCDFYSFYVRNDIFMAQWKDGTDQ